MKKITQLTILLFLTLIFSQCTKKSEISEPPIETVTDADGNVYQTIKMGNQVWMLQNLKTTKYNDGIAIPKWTSGNDWYHSLNPVPYYQWANTADLNNVYSQPLSIDYYGAMYNEIVLSSGKLAPNGWRIPTEQDFKVLEAYVTSQGHSGDEATVLKSKTGWVASSGIGTDIFGFKGLPNGYVAHGGTATGSEIICSWATADVDLTTKTRRIVSLFNNGQIFFASNGVSLGAGVRCIKN